ncbi:MULTISPECIES: porin [Caballeronia]|jgi:predicted porin|uniref:Porin n=1 Tax=Caballeronia zhejiangensis TaxID=871203 RepID=A0A656QG43_9BURK|nr:MULTISPECIES: porin [Caballeronia]EKS67709.1 porin [Burkholderia sp. SJ98]KDR26887.1 porin [Caballeronia zhejiangensis]MCG7405569.1 porin [Caballeronia zhejiangensis]MCI1047693.1 porin [Caballeronia zhejiangensis]MDR5787262.1 porin [Caballeronia sp. LP003]
MKGFTMTKAAIVAATAFAAAAPAFAQSSVTLYGIVDDSIVYQSSQTNLAKTNPGRSNIKTGSGIWAGSRFGLKGAEDLGGGNKAIFQLESGFDINSGQAQFTNALFGRQAWVGLTNPAYGTLTAGRQYTSYYTLLSPYSPTNWLTGYFGAHPGDLDGLDTIYRANNSIVYTSPKFYGLTVSGSYSFAGVPDSVYQGSTWTAALQYQQGPIGGTVAFSRINNAAEGGGIYSSSSTTINSTAATDGSGQPGVSAVTAGYQRAQAQQRFAVAGGYQFNSAWDISVTYTNVQYIPGVNSRFTDEAVFNTAGTVLHWKATSAWDFAAGYSYTWASKANGINDAASYHQFNLSQYYSLSKRTGLYALEAFQRANGNTLAVPSNTSTNRQTAANATIGDGFQSAPSASRSMFAAGVGIIHRF